MVDLGGRKKKGGVGGGERNEGKDVILYVSRYDLFHSGCKINFPSPHLYLDFITVICQTCRKKQSTLCMFLVVDCARIVITTHCLRHATVVSGMLQVSFRCYSITATPIVTASW